MNAASLNESLIVDVVDSDAIAENDSDSDGILDTQDNCILVFNPNQADLNANAIGV